MHEMGIAAEVVRIAAQEAASAGAERVAALRVRVGRWSGVEVECLRFALEVLTEEGPCRGCRVEIESVEPRFACRSCGHGYEGRARTDPCPQCGGLEADLVAGDELRLAEIEVPE